MSSRYLSDYLYFYCIRCGEYFRCRLSEGSVDHLQDGANCGEGRISVLVAEEASGSVCPSDPVNNGEWVGDLHCPMCATALTAQESGKLPRHMDVEGRTCPFGQFYVISGALGLGDDLISLIRAGVPQVTRDGDLLNQKWELCASVVSDGERTCDITCPLCFRGTKLNVARGKIYSHTLPYSASTCRASDMIAAMPVKGMSSISGRIQRVTEGSSKYEGSSRKSVGRSSLSSYPTETTESVRTVSGGLPSGGRRRK